MECTIRDNDCAGNTSTADSPFRLWEWVISSGEAADEQAARDFVLSGNVSCDGTPCLDPDSLAPFNVDFQIGAHRYRLVGGPWEEQSVRAEPTKLSEPDHSVPAYLFTPWFRGGENGEVLGSWGDGLSRARPTIDVERTESGHRPVDPGLDSM